MDGSLFERIYEIVKTVPVGKVVTYGQVAFMAGNPRASRAVGWALHVNPDEEKIPCHRVVNRFGGLSSAFAFGGKDEHKARLEREGIEVVDYLVDLERYQWEG